MTVKKQTCYTAHCDECDEVVENADGFTPHYNTEGEALSDVTDADWWVWEGHVWCPNCLPPCVCGHLFGEHDYGEAPCEPFGADCSCQNYSPKPESKEVSHA